MTSHIRGLTFASQLPGGKMRNIYKEEPWRTCHARDTRISVFTLIISFVFSGLVCQVLSLLYY